MYRVLLIGMLLLAAPAAALAQKDEDKDKPKDKPVATTKAEAPKHEPAPTVVNVASPVGGWETFVLVFMIVLLVIIAIQLMMLRSDIAKLLEGKTQGGPGSSPS